MTSDVGRTVLVLGHPPEVCARLARELEAFAFVEVASTRDDVLDVLERRRVFGVVTELDLGPGPGRDGRGLELLRAASMRAPGCVRILLTAQRLAVLDDRSSRAIDVVFNVPWPRGAILDHLRARASVRS